LASHHVVGPLADGNHSITASAPSSTHSYTVLAFDAAGNQSARCVAVSATRLPLLPRRFDQQLEHVPPVLEIQFTGAPHGLKRLVPAHDDAHGACRCCPAARRRLPPVA
jgi:hypothetical protein